MRLIDADALYNGAMKEEYFGFKAHDEDGRESFAYSCAMQRLAEAPTVPAIPVEWIEWRIMNAKYNKIKEAADAFEFALKCWEEQEAQND